MYALNIILFLLCILSSSVLKLAEVKGMTGYYFLFFPKTCLTECSFYFLQQGLTEEQTETIIERDVLLEVRT